LQFAGYLVTLPVTQHLRRNEGGVLEMNPDGLPAYPLHIQHTPCPRCRSRRTVQTDLSALKQTLQCPDCGHVWERVIPKT